MSLIRIAVLSLLILAPSGAGATEPPPAQRFSVSHACVGQIAAVSLDHFAVSAKLMDLFDAEKFDALDAALSCLLASTTRLQSGHTGASAAYTFYRRTLPAPGLGEVEAGRVSRWKAKHPESIFAEFALLRLAYASAWRIRGGNYASQTPEENMRRFTAAIGSTARAIQAASPRLKQTVLWQQLHLAAVQDALPTPSKWQSAFEAGVRKWPDFYDFYEAAASRKTPRWGGSWKEVDSFAETWSTARAAADGDSLYARLYLHLYWHGIDPRLSQTNWPRLRASLSELLRRYPTALHINAALSLACLNSDQNAYKTFLQGIPAFMPRAWFEGTDVDSCTTRLAR
jgi:hypothetical protein